MDASPAESQVDVIADLILMTVEKWKVSLAEATRIVQTTGVRPDLAQAAHNRLQRLQEDHWSSVAMVVDGDSYVGDKWFVAPREDGQWARYRDSLHADSDSLQRLDTETSAIVSLLANPSAPGTRRKGLVLGNVQSGKTRNYTGVIAKAADAGYSMVIVLSGMHNNLREQTQARLSKELFNTDYWHSLTSAEADFIGAIGTKGLVANFGCVAAVVKKNAAVLKKLIRTLERDLSPEFKRRNPILIIDDEADQATPNSLAQKSMISSINQRLRDLWEAVPTGTYLAYTATPFANVLMDPDEEKDLFPSDFLATISPGQGYFGAERVFGLADTVDSGDPSEDGLDMVRPIPMEDVSQLTPVGVGKKEAVAPPIPPSLAEALDWYIVATAIRRARDQRDHSSMLVHTTHYVQPHFGMQVSLEAWLRDTAQRVAGGDLECLAAAWTRERKRVETEATLPIPTWSAVASFIPAVVESIEVIVDNGESDDRLNYDSDRPRTVIAVGGGTLSRGLTLEGLVVSYFTRTSNAYDTLMQMGRWFGYRPGYEDLPRVWVAAGLEEDYAFLARVEKDLRDEIASVQAGDFTPAEVGVRIRAHPGRLQVTAANKMWHSNVVQLGLSDAHHQTFLLDGSSGAVLENNRSAVDRLLANSPQSHTPTPSRHPMFEAVTGPRVASFLREFIVHPDQAWLGARSRAQIIDWIDRWASGPVWNVVLMGTQGTRMGADGSVKLGPLSMGCLQRTVLRGSTPDKLNFKAVMSQSDRICDIDPRHYAGEPSSTDADRRRVRRRHGDGKGLVVIYPISKDSNPKPGSTTRMTPPVDENLVAFSVFYPAVHDPTGKQGAFVSVKADWPIPVSVEGDEDEETADG